ncbi:endonuclease III [Methanosalsum zhilinae DSM 4017]|uniref:Endonuclease III n=1 Tax=Methanosalsum zhilinae (strain DSM 4017 / NBRC 107636 / OCM 62 / WeN5) TaxID=679901 RepID=F7XL38_METZD|nr:endonuclease III [Methanosalsum zhilinae]AEH61850.1 endonuclease III [Methanosalsum zhilinae DSM 4017]
MKDNRENPAIKDAQERFTFIWNILKENYPDPEPALNYKNPLELLVATVLSAQATDAQVNRVTEKLFSKYQTLEDFAQADLNELEMDVYSTGFYRNKARNIKESARIIIEDFNSRIPEDMDGLLKLPGIGRKTANIILSRAFGKNCGIAVDTHVARLAGRLGFTDSKNPEKIEKELMALADKVDWEDLSMTLILHGRRVCHARGPECEVCVVNHLCPSSRIA